MAAVSTIVAATAAVAAIAGTAHTVSESNNARRTAKMTGDTQKQAQENAEAELQKQEDVEEATAARDAERLKARGALAAKGGRDSTILTSPLGTTSAPQVSGKTALGA